jgi:hypothetical protein
MGVISGERGGGIKENAKAERAAKTAKHTVQNAEEKGTCRPRGVQGRGVRAAAPVEASAGGVVKAARGGNGKNRLI